MIYLNFLPLRRKRIFSLFHPELKFIITLRYIKLLEFYLLITLPPKLLLLGKVLNILLKK